MRSTYETFAERTTFERIVETADVDGEIVQRNEWRSYGAQIFGHKIPEEANKTKSRDTMIHASRSLMEADYIWNVTASPMQNSELVP